MKWLHNFLKGASLTGALFVFQACYGMPQPPEFEDAEEAPVTASAETKAGDEGEDIVPLGEAENATDVSEVE